MGVARMRLQINPDAAFGMIFDFEGAYRSELLIIVALCLS